MADNARGIHVSPGIYSKETEISYAVKSLGITTLGVVGETVKGPAFQPMLIENWREFQDMFGGTNPEKFAGSQYPKYELPYIAKSYLTESNQLQVCRVLGLGGYNAGPAWVIKAKGTGDYDNMVVAVLRSRGHYEKSQASGSCSTSIMVDKLVYDCEENVTLKPYTTISLNDNCSATTLTTGATTASTSMVCESTVLDYGRFVISNSSSTFSYSVSLNPTDKDYILKVLGTDPFNGSTALYVESLYDVALRQGIESGNIGGIYSNVEFYQVGSVADYGKLEPVFDIMSKAENMLTKRDVGLRVLADSNAAKNGITYHKALSADSGSTETVKVGKIYVVEQYTDSKGQRHYYYTHNSGDTLYNAENADSGVTTANTVVKVLSNGRYYKVVTSDSDKDVKPITCDMNHYKEAYRFASTPWFVSNIKGDGSSMELNKLFRFHTISDGDAANREIKVSIQNIKTDDMTFDVVIRDINDTDEMPVVLERFTKCTMIPSSLNYIAYKIGSFDGTYESKSKYITVEVNESLVAQNSVPCGFLGYPLSQFSGVSIVEGEHSATAPIMKYNTEYNEDVKHRRQYFGLSTSVGVDIDAFTYKGYMAYGEEPDYLCQGFHLDSRLSLSGLTVKVDGVNGYTFDTVGINSRTSMLNEIPIIGTEVEMEGCLFEYVDLRKFTAYFYGGFDGWDIYRDARSNTDEFKLSKYQGAYDEVSGEGNPFSKIADPDALGLNQNGITSDFYAYLAGIRQFANPEAVDINVFATPGIDILNNKLLVEEAIEMIEEERADSIYVVTTPDKPYGASDSINEMYTPDDVVYELNDTEIDSNYACTYYPWVKYEDKDNNQYIFLPPTRDVVRNMAKTDNTAYPWFAPAGIDRGNVEGVRTRLVTKIADEDMLYDGRINPIKSFSQDGLKIWGQKNLKKGEASLNRIATRRLLLRMRKLISIACLGLIFEPNDSTVRNTFLSFVTPIMDSIKANRGISDYRIEVEDTVESRQRRELNVRIFFKPYNCLEYINLDFAVTPEGVSFDAI